MAGSINKVILLGRLGADPEIRVSQEGNKIARFSVATSETWKDKSTSEKKDRTEWHKIVIFSPGLSEIAEKYLKKGSLIYIEGQLRNRKYTDQSGMEKNISEIVLQGYNTTLTMIDNRNNSDIKNELSSPSLDNSTTEKNVTSDFDSINVEDEVPF
ncbi:MAG: single-stranded DNA-binding protein [Rickettsiales bacterium]|nr:single-stranded DNA-binding protein [Rickettsiales bacterium]